LNFNSYLKKELTNLSSYQTLEPSPAKPWEKIEKDPSTSNGKYVIRKEVLHNINVGTHSYWRAMLPGVPGYVHTLSWPQGTDNSMYQISQFSVSNTWAKM
jgi:hypothetical protein